MRIRVITGQRGVDIVESSKQFKDNVIKFLLHLSDSKKRFIDFITFLKEIVYLGSL